MTHRSDAHFCPHSAIEECSIDVVTCEKKLWSLLMVHVVVTRNWFSWSVCHGMYRMLVENLEEEISSVALRGNLLLESRLLSLLFTASFRKIKEPESQRLCASHWHVQSAFAWQPRGHYMRRSCFVLVWRKRLSQVCLTGQGIKNNWFRLLKFSGLSLIVICEQFRRFTRCSLLLTAAPIMLIIAPLCHMWSISASDPHTMAFAT